MLACLLIAISWGIGVGRNFAVTREPLESIKVPFRGRFLMRISDILVPARVVCDVDAKSMKGLLKTLAQLLTVNLSQVTRREVLDSLINRERLGSTGLGQGVAIPHARTHSSQETIGAFAKLKTGIDFNAADKHPVDLFFALLVPQHSADEHLQILASLAEMFSEQSFLDRIRTENSQERLYQLLIARPDGPGIQK